MRLCAVWLLGVLICVTAVAGCSSTPTITPTPSGTRSSSNGLPVGEGGEPIPGPRACTLGSRNGQPLPDHTCTPGAINPAVNQANLSETICKSGWTKTVRPPVSVTNRIKKDIDLAYGLPTTTSGELDHLVSLELGGAPDDPRNLWVEPGRIPNPKDAVENKLNQAVCSGLIPLATAQQTIATSWTTAFDDTGLRIAGGKVCLREQPTKCVSSRHR